jgi:hypothetical protein
MRGTDEPKKKRGGGPTTPEGKARSRRNAIKHGNRSVQCLILADETMEEYTAVRAEWLEHFQPEEFPEKVIVEELISAHWLFKRAKRRLMETEFALAGSDNVHPVEWTGEDEHKIELMQRYKTSAERSFYRALAMARKLLTERIDLENKMRKASAELEFWRKKNETLKEQIKRDEMERADAGVERAQAKPAVAEPVDVRRDEKQHAQRAFRAGGAKKAEAVAMESGVWAEAVLNTSMET